MSARSKRIQLSLLSGCLFLFAAESASAAFVARFTTKGALDGGFNGTGYVASVGTITDANDVHVDGKGRIVSCGEISQTNARHGIVSRINPDGRLDASFGYQGVVTLNYPFFTSITACAVTSTNKIVAVAAVEWKPERWLIARFNEDGTPDRSFGPEGWVQTQFSGASRAVPWAVRVLGDGRIAVVGDVSTQLAAARYKSDGTLDAAYGWQGVTVVPGGSFPGGILVDDWGRVIAAGNRSRPYQLVTHRLGYLGLLDSSYSGDGTAEFTFPGYEFVAHGATMDWDDRYLVAGVIAQGDFVRSGFGVVRIHRDGRLDTSFGRSGFVDTRLPLGEGRAVAIGTDSKIVVAGFAQNPAGEVNVALARYFEDGRLDSDFGSQGTVLTGIGNAGALGFALVLDGQNRPIVAGRTSPW